jgi:hypothetical protein
VLLAEVDLPEVLALKCQGAPGDLLDVERPLAGCSNPAERSFNIKQVARSSLTLKSQDLRQVHLCKEHYKEYKKETKNDRELDQVYR